MRRGGFVEVRRSRAALSVYGSLFGFCVPGISANCGRRGIYATLIAAISGPMMVESISDAATMKIEVWQKDMPIIGAVRVVLEAMAGVTRAGAGASANSEGG